MRDRSIFLMMVAFVLHGMVLKAEISFIKIQNYAITDTLKEKGQIVRIMFYNIENLYDPYDDTTKADEEFTPSGTKYWNYKKFLTKLNHLSKTILAAGGWEPPGIIGLCEAENRYVLNKLVWETPLRQWGYKIIHEDSPDTRGVDVALLYRPSLLRPVFSHAYRIEFPFDRNAKTRDILYVKGTIAGGDTIHLLVNHWPSRRGGTKESEPRRLFVASVVRRICDSVIKGGNADIIIMGDFNDEPECESIRVVLGAEDKYRNDTSLVNLMSDFGVSGRGTHKFSGRWGILDQFIVTGNLLTDKKISVSDVIIFSPSFLLEEDDRFLSKRPQRTYSGPRYTGGFSDHLPVLLELKIMQN